MEDNQFFAQVHYILKRLTVFLNIMRHILQFAVCGEGVADGGYGFPMSLSGVTKARAMNRPRLVASARLCAVKPMLPRPKAVEMLGIRANSTTMPIRQVQDAERGASQVFFHRSFPSLIFIIAGIYMCFFLKLTEKHRGGQAHKGPVGKMV
ncbi:MAG: hypothetical protein Q7V00_14375 [Sulfurimicrobium sp.]|nr:hypothetical protein [Sulfurimicrobium sp.]MDP1703353.1 hypothetical protein [Sulfurimicrobium sp.]MDP3688217.1 hypothetical protein [Sulfurimicrobium sp.]